MRFWQGLLDFFVKFFRDEVSRDKALGGAEGVKLPRSKKSMRSSSTQQPRRCGWSCCGEIYLV